MEYIRDHRDMAHGREYYIYWKGWPTSDDEWIHENHMDSPDLIAEYLSSLIQAPMQRTRERRGARAAARDPSSKRPLRVGFDRDQIAVTE